MTYQPTVRPSKKPTNRRTLGFIGKLHLLSFILKISIVVLIYKVLRKNVGFLKIVTIISPLSKMPMANQGQLTVLIISQAVGKVKWLQKIVLEHSVCVFVKDCILNFNSQKKSFFHLIFCLTYLVLRRLQLVNPTLC